MGVGRWERVVARQTSFKKASISDSRFATAKSTGISEGAGEGPSAIQKARVIVNTVRVCGPAWYFSCELPGAITDFVVVTGTKGNQSLVALWCAQGTLSTRGASLGRAVRCLT